MDNYSRPMTLKHDGIQVFRSEYCFQIPELLFTTIMNTPWDTFVNSSGEYELIVMTKERYQKIMKMIG